MSTDIAPYASILDVSVIVPALNAANSLAATLSALSGVREILVVDSGSQDDTAGIAKCMGARLIKTARGRGVQLHAGAQQARSEWLLFLHADTVLTGNWRKEVEQFIGAPGNHVRAATFRFALDDMSRQARRLEQLVAWRTRRFGLPYGDQGLLIHRGFYQALGGYPPWPLMEDVELVRRIGRPRLTIFSAAAHTSAERWRRGGWILRSLRNLSCLGLYYLGTPPRLLTRWYG